MRAGTGIEATLLRIKEYMEQHGITWTTPPGTESATGGAGAAHA
jgi:hypothetical protein